MAKDYAELRTENAALRQETAELRALVGSLRERIQDLEERLVKNSRNSSKPPLSDPPGTGQRQTTKRVKGQRSRGGQVGRVGKTRPLLPAEQVDTLVDLVPDDCAFCGEGLADAPDCGEPLRHQVTEIPPVWLSKAGQRTTLRVGSTNHTWKWGHESVGGYGSRRADQGPGHRPTAADGWGADGGRR